VGLQCDPYLSVQLRFGIIEPGIETGMDKIVDLIRGSTVDPGWLLDWLGKSRHGKHCQAKQESKSFHNNFLVTQI
jgi:hypothetical protein